MWHKGNQYSHDVIQVLGYCTKCARTFWATFEFSSSGKEARWGRYKNCKSTSDVKTNLTFQEVCDDYKTMPSSGWSLCGYNCKVWARELWWKLMSTHKKKSW